jgi:aspartate oxidase
MAANSQRNYDFLVIGSGIAGLTYALNVARAGTVAIITKKQRAESNTNYAQGGIAAVMAKDDSFELHVRDTLEAGAGLCKEDVVRTIVSEGPALVRELIEFGVGRFAARFEPFVHDDVARRARADSTTRVVKPHMKSRGDIQDASGETLSRIGNAFGIYLDRLALAGELVKALALVLHGAHHRGDLLDLADE